MNCTKTMINTDTEMQLSCNFDLTHKVARVPSGLLCSSYYQMVYLERCCSVGVYSLNYNMTIWLWRQPPTQRCGMYLPIHTHRTFPGLAARTQIPSIWNSSTELQLPVQWDAFIPPIWFSSCLHNLLHPLFQFDSELNMMGRKSSALIL